MLFNIVILGKERKKKTKKKKKKLFLEITSTNFIHYINSVIIVILEL